MGQALYRTYRPRSLSEVVGQEHVTRTLEQALKQGRISHAYLFTGPRGVGKTSIARILAHQINDLPYTDDAAHLDIIEIDAASNRRIDEIRDLRDKVHIAPTSAKYKVYIIDEVHMLTREAFNALLKTLEEPPAHVVFILATTDAHKLPETIISRTQRYTFKPVGRSDVVAHLQEIAKTEKITISDEALELIAEHGEGSFRDSISMLDQAQSDGKAIGIREVERLLGVPSRTAIEELYVLVTQGSAAEIVQKLDDLYGQGYQPAAIAKALGQLTRASLVHDNARLAKDAALDLLKELLEVNASHNPERFLEIVLLRSMQVKEQPRESEAQVARSTEVGPSPESYEPESGPVPEPKAKSEKILQPSEKVNNNNPPKASAISGELDTENWKTVLDSLKKRHNTLYSVVRMAHPSFEKDKVTLAFAFAFHQKRLSESSNRQALLDTVKEVTGRAVTLDCVLDKPEQAPTTVSKKKTASADTRDLAAISNIFGGGELLES
jgi:DNA polymerase-3 subunit gamma/tau